MRPGTTGQRKRSANMASAFAVIAGRPKNGTAMPLFIFWSISMPSRPPWRRIANERRAPSAPFGTMSVTGWRRIRCTSHET